MGGSGRWIKSLIGLKKPQSSTHQDKEGKGKKWKMWRSDSGGMVKGGHVSGSEVESESSFDAAVATVVRAPIKDFMAMRREWAAIRIQTVFRAFLARQALRALKAVVRIQAIFRGRQIRKQADLTLQCMQALVRIQARDQWCNSPGTIEEVKAKLQMKHEGALKRERAIAYYLSQQQQLKTSPSANSRTTTNPPVSHKLLKNGSSGSWLDRWMASRPWENKSTDGTNSDLSKSTSTLKKHEESFVGSRVSFSELDSVKVRRNNVSTRIMAKPPIISCDESSTSTSSMSNSGTKIVEDSSGYIRPNYMNPTKSIRAKQRASPYSSQNVKLKANVEMDLYSGALCKDLYPPMYFE